jgi:hypothetical protein
VYLARYREVISLFSCLWFILFTYRLVCNLIIWLFSFLLFHRLVLLDHCHVTVGGNKRFSNWSIVSFFLFLLLLFFPVKPPFMWIFFQEKNSIKLWLIFLATLAGWCKGVC